MATLSTNGRLARIEETVKTLLVRERFTLAEVKQSLPAENPAYVTRIVHDLERDGHLRAEHGAYSWTRDPSEIPAQAWIAGRVHGAQLSEAPPEDRPRERLLVHGAGFLQTGELLAILIRSGRMRESALQAGGKVAARYKDKLHQLAGAGRGELKEITAALGDTAYCQIMAGIELGRRVAQSQMDQPQRPVRILGSEEAKAFCRNHFRRLATDGSQEEFHIATLDAQFQVTATHRVSVGCLDRSVVHPREVYRAAIKDAAKAIIVMHNHPSGNPTPSEEDLLVTRRLEEAGKILGIQLLDHIVVARDGVISIQEFRTT